MDRNYDESINFVHEFPLSCIHHSFCEARIDHPRNLS